MTSVVRIHPPPPNPDAQEKRVRVFSDKKSLRKDVPSGGFKTIKSTALVENVKDSLEILIVISGTALGCTAGGRLSAV